MNRKWVRKKKKNARFVFPRNGSHEISLISGGIKTDLVYVQVQNLEAVYSVWVLLLVLRRIVLSPDVDFWSVFLSACFLVVRQAQMIDIVRAPELDQRRYTQGLSEILPVFFGRFICSGRL